MSDKGAVFRALHEGPGAFIIPNPWDAGSARILAGLGFQALATTSAGMAFALGRRDGGVAREAVLDHCRALVGATALPVSADLEKGFGDSPESAAATVRDAAASGLAGCSIEDFTGRDEAPIFDFGQAVERIAAAAEAARALSQDFVLTARAEGFLHGRPDLDDIIKRLQAFEKAGADVLYAPGLPDLDAIQTVCGSVARPVNVLAGNPKTAFSLAELAAAGARRISVGGALARLAYGAVQEAALEMLDRGTFRFTERALPQAEVERFMTGDCSSASG